MEKGFLMSKLALIGQIVLVSMAWMSQARAQGPQAVPSPQPPFPPLSAAHQQFLDQVLNLWQQRSEAIQRYRCTFARWEYDPVFGPATGFKTYSQGVIKYAAPDKGLFRVEKTMEYNAPAQPGGAPQFVQRPGESGEYWICDGESIYEHDHTNKQLIQRELPPHMQGKAISEGPLPFLFGADAAQIKERYWIQPLPTPADIKDEYWLEAYPKRREDAASYLKVHVIIDQKDFLPKGLVIFDRNFNANNPARTTFTFDKREVNWSIALQQIRFWEREFYEPKIPSGWKKVVEKYDAPDAEQFAPAAVAPAAKQAARPPAGPAPR